MRVPSPSGRVCCAGGEQDQEGLVYASSLSLRASTESSFAGFRFRPDVITLAVRWYLRYGLSYGDVEELLAASTWPGCALKVPARRGATGPAVLDPTHRRCTRGNPPHRQFRRHGLHRWSLPLDRPTVRRPAHHPAPGDHPRPRRRGRCPGPHHCAYIRGSAHPVYTPDQATAETLENTSYLVPPAPPLPGCKQDPITEKPTPGQHRDTQQNSLCDPHSNPLPAIYHPYTALSIGQ